MSRKARLTISLDPEVLEDVRRTVAEARPPMSVSQWVERLLREKVFDEQLDFERRQEGLRKLIEEYEAEHGVITEEEMERLCAEGRAEAQRLIEQYDREDAEAAKSA